MVIWPHKRQSGKSGQNTPDSGSRKRHLISAEKGLFEYCVVGLSCIGQNAKAQIVERDSGFPQLAEIYDTCDRADDGDCKQSGQTTCRVVHAGSGARPVIGSADHDRCVKGATTSAIPTDEMTIGPTTPIQ